MKRASSPATNLLCLSFIAVLLSSFCCYASNEQIAKGRIGRAGIDPDGQVVGFLAGVNVRANLVGRREFNLLEPLLFFQYSFRAGRDGENGLYVEEIGNSKWIGPFAGMTS